MATKATKASKKIEIRGIADHDYVRYGQQIKGGVYEDWNADIEIGKTIRIFGVSYKGTPHEFSFDLTFQIDDSAIYDSYNLYYTGKIVNIGPKTVTIEKYGRRHRLNIYEFAWRNYRYNDKRIAAHNADTWMYI